MAVPPDYPHYTYILAITYSKSSIIPITTIFKLGYSGNVPKRVAALSNPEKPTSVVKGKGITIHNISILATATLPDKQAAIAYEKSLHLKYSPYSHTGSNVLPNGNTELYSINLADIELADSNSLFTRYTP
jgi:hypothetical protein